MKLTFELYYYEIDIMELSLDHDYNDIRQVLGIQSSKSVRQINKAIWRISFSL